MIDGNINVFMWLGNIPDDILDTVDMQGEDGNAI